MPPQAMVHAARHSGDLEPGKIKTGDAIRQASKLTGLPYLPDVAQLALKLVPIAQAVKENKEGFQGLVDHSTYIVAMFYWSYQAKNQDEWLNNKGIRAAARDLERCLESILKLGEKMKDRGLVLRTLCCAMDARTIKKCRQRLQLPLDVFEVDGPASFGPETTPEGSASRAEIRPRQLTHLEDVEQAGISFGPGKVVVENGSAAGASESGGSTPQRQKNKQPSPTSTPHLERNGASASPDISVKGVYGSGIAFGDGDVSVRNW